MAMAAARALLLRFPFRSSCSGIASGVWDPASSQHRSAAAVFSSSTRGASPVPRPPSTPRENAKDEIFLSVDRSGLGPLVEDNGRHRSGKAEQSAMAKHISALIKFRGGPISVAEYMAEVLTNPTSGFYMHRDVFGARGDFVTSPDSSQMFGEMIGVWCMLLWEQMKQPENLTLIELGPGRGTLLADLIRGTAKWQGFARALSIHLVECSPALRKEQEAALDSASKAGVPVTWHSELEQVPRGAPCIVIAHEFYDALPIHQFQKTSRGWCEKLVDVSGGDSNREEFRFVLSPKPTTASTLYLEKRLRRTTKEERSRLEHVEVCPQALKLTADIARRISEDGGGALVVDYGEDKVGTDSLQAIRNHEFGHVLEDPGSADLSAHVDFAAIKHAVEETAGGGASVYGPVTQAKFLGSLGINFRLEALIAASASEEQKESLQLGYWVLVGDGPAPWLDDEDSEGGRIPMGMGDRYKALAILQSGLAAPVGFF